MSKYAKLISSYMTLTWVMTLRTMTLSLGEGPTETPGENSSMVGGMEGQGFPYWVAGTAFPCSSMDKCTFIVNGSDPLGGDMGPQPTEDYEEESPCIVNGRLDISKNWYGYIGEFKLRANGAKLYYTMDYPEEKCCIKLLLYLEEQISQLRAHMNCIQKESVVDPLGPQVITLSPSHPASGCTSNVTAGERRVKCKGGRLLKSDIERTWFVAASSCGSPTGLQLDFALVVYGTTEGECFTLRTSGSAPSVHFRPAKGRLGAHAWSAVATYFLGLAPVIPSYHICAVTATFFYLRL